jgi:hypothetical protein
MRYANYRRCGSVAIAVLWFTMAGARADGVPTRASTGFSTFATQRGTATLADTAIGIQLADVDQGADTIRAVCKNAPATPYTLTGKFTLTAAYGPGGPDSWGGFAWRDKRTGHIQGYGIVNEEINFVPSLFSIDFRDYVTTNWTGEGYVDTYSPTMWIRIADDGLTVTESYSMDGGGFNHLWSAPKTAAYLGSGGYNQVCIFVSAHGSDAKLTLHRYSHTR